VYGHLATSHHPTTTHLPSDAGPAYPDDIQHATLFTAVAAEDAWLDPAHRFFLTSSQSRSPFVAHTRSAHNGILSSCQIVKLLLQAARVQKRYQPFVTIVIYTKKISTIAVYILKHLCLTRFTSQHYQRHFCPSNRWCASHNHHHIITKKYAHKTEGVVQFYPSSFSFPFTASITTG
jgi:hypothetical protein